MKGLDELELIFFAFWMREARAPTATSGETAGRPR